MPRMNDQTKLVYALEHIAHLHDLIEGNYWEDYLRDNLNSLEYVLESQVNGHMFQRIFLLVINL